MSSYENQCFRCGQLVYQVDKIGPLKDFSFFHHQCFKCSICGTKLTLRTYFNSHDQDDKEVYCSSHAPKTGPGRLDGHSVGIRAALNVPKTSSLVNEQIRGSGKGTFDAEAISIKQHIRMPHKDGAIVEANVTTNSGSNAANNNISYAGKFDASALHIRHALQATELQRKYKFHSSERSINEYLDRDVQKNLEMVHRKEEDDLYHIFATQRAEEEVHINQQIQEEWEKELEKLASRFESELRLKKRKISTEEQRALTVRHQKERDDLEKNMTLKRDKKREVLTRKRLEQERAATAALVEKHSSEMLNLINQKKTEFLRTNSYYDSDSNYNDDEELVNPYPSHPPPPHPPSHPKSEVYNDPQVFADLDQIAINVAQEDQKTFTDLVRQLVGRCSSDVEKARAIFRWITVKNLNTMQFDENVRADTPMALLRGIKYGTESYHVLFKRLCSYVGLHCMVIKGYSKSAGYQPGIKFEDNRFRNSWNAVYVAGAWRFVQCNWGARHLVNAKDALKSASHSNSSSKTANKTDSLRYEYDDHYFLTDPNEFIHEFFPMQMEWQLLRKPITLEEFEDMPFVRSLFFRYGLYLPPEDETRAVSRTDSTGAATLRIGMPASMAATLIFHYNLKFYEGDVDVYDGLSLKRYVMQSVVGNVVAFRVHAPCAGLPLLLDIFANAVTPKEYLTGEPMKFKSVCKFKIICGDLKTVMVPLPDCASGEWGPMKAARLFGLVPLTHQDALIFGGREVEIQLRMSRKLTDFMAALHRNGFDEKKLARYVSHSITDDIVTFRVTFVEEGQYGLDIYTRDVDNEHVKHRSYLESGEKQLLTHCCKYLINSSKRN